MITLTPPATILTPAVPAVPRRMHGIAAPGDVNVSSTVRIGNKHDHHKQQKQHFQQRQREQYNKQLRQHAATWCCEPENDTAGFIMYIASKLGFILLRPTRQLVAIASLLCRVWSPKNGSGRSPIGRDRGSPLPPSRCGFFEAAILLPSRVLLLFELLFPRERLLALPSPLLRLLRCDPHQRLRPVERPKMMTPPVLDQR